MVVKNKLTRKELTSRIIALEERSNLHEECIRELETDKSDLNEKIKSLESRISKIESNIEEALEAIKNAPTASTIMREWLIGEQ